MKKETEKEIKLTADEQIMYDILFPSDGAEEEASDEQE